MSNRMSLRLALAAAMAGLAGCTTVLLPPNVEPVVEPSTSLEQAARRLVEVKAERAATLADYAASEQLCYGKFFVNNCLDMAKEKRRGKLAVLRAREVEAERYQRQAAVDQRDREVAQAVKEFEAGEARMAALPAPAPRAEPVAVDAPKPALKDRRAERAAKDAARAQQARAEAPQRAAKAKAFEERKLRAEARQRKIAEKKAANDAKAAEAAR
jgi:colicin import membrane protein